MFVIQTPASVKCNVGLKTMFYNLNAWRSERLSTILMGITDVSLYLSYFI